MRLNGFIVHFAVVQAIRIKKIRFFFIVLSHPAAMHNSMDYEMSQAY